MSLCDFESWLARNFLSIIIIVKANGKYLKCFFFLNKNKNAPTSMENSYLKWETLAGTCTTKLCSLLKQRQNLEDFFQDAEVPPRSQFEEFKAQKRAPGMEFLGKRAPYLQHHNIPMVEKRAPGIYFINNNNLHYV